MTFTIKKTSNYGTEHPFIARLKLQTHEIIQWAALSQENSELVVQVYFGLAERYIKLHESHLRLKSAIEDATKNLKPQKNARVLEVPHAIGIEGEVEVFLYEAKNYLRDLTKVLNIFFGTNFDKASDFFDATGKTTGPICEWARTSFGKEDNFSKMLVGERGWVGTIVKKSQRRGTSGW